MGVVMVPVILQLVKLCVIGFAFTVQGSTGHNISPSPASFSEIPPTEGTPGPIHQIKSSSGNAPSSVFQPNGSDLHPPVVLPPLASTPVPKIVKGLVPSLSPSTPTAVLPPHNTAPPPAIVQGHIPSLSPSTPIVSQPDNTAPPPLIVQGRAPSLSPTTPSVSPPYKTAPPPLIVQGHTPSLSPTTPSVSPPYKTAPPPLIVQGHAPSLSPTTPIVSTPSKTAPSPLIVSKGNATSLFPNTPTEPAPYNTAPPPLVVQGHVPSMPPNVPQTKAPVRKNPVPATVAPVPVATPSNALPQNAPSIHPSMPGTLPPTAHQRNASHNKAPIPEPIAPDVSPPRQSGQNPQAAHPVMPGITPSILPGPVASPTSELPRNSPATPPVMPRESPSILPVVPYEDVDPPHVPPASTPPPSIDRKKDGIPVAAPPNETPKPLPPLNHSPTKDPHFPPASTPPPSIDRKKDAIPVAAPPNETPKPLPPVNRSPTKAPSTHKAMRHSLDAPLPSPSSPKSPLNEGHHSPASSPSTSFDKPHNARNKITGPAPASSYLVSPPASKQRGPVIPPANLPTSRQTHYAPPPFNPGSSLSPFHLPHLSSVSHVSPAPSPSPIAVPGHTEIPDLSPKVSPSGSSSRSPKMPPLPPIRALPPPPPNEDCSGTTCTEPYTNTPPGAPCSCVWPMQVGLRLSVALYTFFPLVSELAEEIAAGVFMKQSQVRIMGANAASQQPEKTVVLIDLVPLGQQFDNTTALLIDQRFWLKQVVIKASFFGDYEVLYVHYPGLPPSPPLPPSSINVIDGGPYSGNDNNGRKIKPLGVDVGTRQHKNGLSGGIIAIIILSVAVTMILVSAVAWVLLFKHRDHVCQPVTTPQPLPSSLSKPSGIAGSITGSGLSSASLSFGSSIATYTGSAKTFSTSDIEKATDNFDDSKILGEGGFGRVYSGVLEDGTKVAVKVLKRDDQQGGREFLAEVEMLSRLHHRNLVKLIGICTEERSRCLVYELIPNGSVESHLHGVDKESAPLGWDARIKIALGAARGLAYLHEDSSPRVIHRDFKSSNILLEHDFTPKVSDFGLARTALDEQSRHISTRVMGTFGYVAPEYAMTGHLLVKSDVYSYGVVLLELLTGRKPVDMSQPPGQENLVAWARPLLTNKEGLETMVDPTLGSDFPFDSVGKVAAIASMCVQPEVSHRPFMGEVVQALKLVSNECDEAKEVGSRSSCQDDLSIDFEATVSTGSGQVPDPSQRQHSGPNYDSGFDPERGLSDLFGTTERFGRQESGSFRRYSSSGPLRTGRGRQFWQKLRRLSGGSVSEHGVMFRLWPGSH